ncbi:putative reverse transcriptase domain-containing protein [Tanacetum coccineum]
MVASLPLRLPSPLITSPTDAGEPLGYRAVGIRMRARAPRLEIEESSAAGAARQPGTTLEADLRRDRVMEMSYGITDTWDDIVEAMLEKMTPRKRTTRASPAITTTPTSTHVTDAQLKALIERGIAAMLAERDADMSKNDDDNHDSGTGERRQTSSKDRSAAIEAHVRIQEAQVTTLIAQTLSLQTQLTTVLRHIKTLEARDPEPQDEPAEAGSSYYHDSGTGERRQASTVRECTYTDFLKCQPMNFKGTEGVVGLTQWLEKMESIFHISNCTVACQVKFATCTLQGNALTWWNSYVRAVGHDVAYAMPWKTLKKMMTDKYCPRGEIKKLEIEMWNLKVKGTDVMSYNQHFQELVLMCDRMFPEESDVVEKYVGGLPDMIHGSVKASKPKTMQEKIEFSTELMDKNILTIIKCQAENKRKFKDTSRNNQNQQQPFKRNNVAHVYTVGHGEKKPYGGIKPLCPKCNYHHEGPCAPKCTNCKRIGHLARDCKNRHATANNNQIAQGINQRVLTCYECGAQGHFRSDCPKLKNENQGNQAGNGNAVASAYAVGTTGTNPNSNAVTGTFLLNNHHTSILFDTGADRSFISTAFSSLIDIIPTTLDHGYDVELADGRIIWVNTLIQGCTLNFLNHPFNIDLMPVEMGSFDVIIGMDWLTKYHAVFVFDEKLIRVPFGSEILTFHGDESNNGPESRLNIIPCTKTQKYLLKGCPIFLAHVTMKKAEDKSKE